MHASVPVAVLVYSYTHTLEQKYISRHLGSFSRTGSGVSD